MQPLDVTMRVLYRQRPTNHLLPQANPKPKLETCDVAMLALAERNN